MSLDVEAGRITGVLGANGAGKTTTLLGIHGAGRNGCRDASSSTAETSPGLSTAELVAAGVALCPENRRLFPNMSIEDNLLLGAYGCPAARAAASASAPPTSASSGSATAAVSSPAG